MKPLTLLLLLIMTTACAKTHKETNDLRHQAQRGFWSKSISENYRRLYADVMIDIQREVLACYGGGPVKGSRPGSGSNFSTTTFFPHFNRDDKNYSATVSIWRGGGADAAAKYAKGKSRVMFVVDIKGSGDGRSGVTVFGPRRGWNDEMQAFLYWAGGGKGQCSWH